MNDEIKEILDRLDYDEWEVDLYKVPITWCELYTIRDYLTNLQQENERLNHQLEVQNELTERNRLRKHSYKSRIEKANKTLKNWEKLELDDLLVAIRKTQKILNGKE